MMDDSICRTVVSKLNGKHRISFGEIARTAYDEGRGRLAGNTGDLALEKYFLNTYADFFHSS